MQINHNEFEGNNRMMKMIKTPAKEIKNRLNMYL